MRKFNIRDEQIEMYSEAVFHNALREIWGATTTTESDDGEVEMFLKLGHKVGAWIEGGGFGYIIVPHFVADDKFLELDV